MKICFFNRSYWPDQAATGQFLTELAEDLVSRHGTEVTVVAGRPLNKREFETINAFEISKAKAAAKGKPAPTPSAEVVALEACS